MSRTVFGFKPILFLTLALILALAAACSSGDDDTTTTSTSGTTTEPAAPAAAQAAPTAAPAVITSVGTPVAAAAPIAASGLVMAEPVQAKITRVVFGLTAPQVENFTPAKNGPPDGQPLTPMYEYLVGMDPLTGQLIPQLATGWEVDPDGKSCRFFLREDGQFPGGGGGCAGRGGCGPGGRAVGANALRRWRGNRIRVGVFFSSWRRPDCVSPPPIMRAMDCAVSTP